MIVAPHASTSRAPGASVLRVFALVRYRFFLYAGLMPYLLGAAWAYAMVGEFDAPLFWSGFGGVVLSVIGVEAFNEYFDAQMGTDRVFNPADLPPILAFALAGGAAAIFYEAPPIRWSYRGLGESVIGLAYGPWMVLGSLSLHTNASISWAALGASLVPGLIVMALAVVNAIPDFHQDRLVGKRNLVVRLGRQRAVVLYATLVAAAFACVAIGVAVGAFPVACLAALLAIPLLVASVRRAIASHERPREFVAAVRAIVACYVLATTLFIGGILVGAWR